ncbi:MAG: DUF6134 family protein [Caulobacteraceae bacterium]|nr:DUF6134 family protein [Caulobacteraceae bacterium]
MAWTSSLKTAAIVAGLALPAAAVAAPRTFVYSVNHSHYGDIGTYERTIDQTGGVIRARSRLLIAVKMMGMVVHRERDDQTEVWRDRRLVSFNSVSDTAGQHLAVSGEASAGKFLITSPSGTTTAPADVAAADPWGLDHVGRGQAVSIKSGKVEQVDVTGGQPERIVVGGVAMQARHFSASTAAQPDKWDVWIDRDGVPVKFRSREGKAMVDFTLVSPNPAGGPLAEARLAPGG